MRYRVVRAYLAKKMDTASRDERLSQLKRGPYNADKYTGEGFKRDGHGRFIINSSLNSLASSVNSTVWYHGSGLANLKELDWGGGIDGAGVYLTKDIKRAHMYASRGGDGSDRRPYIYEVKVNVDKVWDDADENVVMSEYSNENWAKDLILDGMNARTYLGSDCNNLLRTLGFDAILTYKDLIVLDKSCITQIVQISDLDAGGLSTSTKKANFERDLNPEKEMKGQLTLQEALRQRTKHIPIPKPVENEAEALGQKVFDVLGLENHHNTADSLITKVERKVLTPKEARPEAIRISIHDPLWLGEFRKAKILTGDEPELDAIDSAMDGASSYGTRSMHLWLANGDMEFRTIEQVAKILGSRVTYDDVAKAIVRKQKGYKRNPDGYSWLSPHLDRSVLDKEVRELAGLV